MINFIKQGDAYPLEEEGIVNRTEQHEAFLEVITRIRSKSPFQHNLLEWYGAPGIGKTTLIRLLITECKQKNIPWLFIDFDQIKEEVLTTYALDPIRLVEEIVEFLAIHNIDISKVQAGIDLYRATLTPPEGICSAYMRMPERERPYSDEPWLKSMRDVLRQLDWAVDELIKGDQGEVRPLVLFVDAADNGKVPEYLVDWIEEFLVRPLVQTKRCIVVWTARHPRKWKRPEIRWDRKSEELHTFNLAEVQELVEQSPYLKSAHNLTEQLFKNVYLMTGGHPYAGSVAVRVLSEWDDVNLASFTTRKCELLNVINQLVIQNHAFKNLTHDQRMALQLLSMLRLIDTTTLHRVLKECGGQPFESWQRKEFDELLYDLRKTYLLRWSNSGWTIEPSLRHLIRNYYLSCEVDIFEKVNRSALGVYQDWLSRPVDNRKLFLIEELYHYSSLEQVSIKERDVTNVLEERISQYPEEVRKDAEGWRLTLEQIEGEIEHDEELVRLVGELKCKELIAVIKNRA